jgi:hypothetical protein
MAKSKAIIAMTTNISIRVKPYRLFIARNSFLSSLNYGSFESLDLAQDRCAPFGKLRAGRCPEDRLFARYS